MITQGPFESSTSFYNRLGDRIDAARAARAAAEGEGMSENEQTTMGRGGPRNTARRAAGPHPGSRLVRERIQPPGSSTVSDDDGDQGDDKGEGSDDG